MNGGKKVTGRKKNTNTPVLSCFLSQENGGDTTSVSHFSKTLGSIPVSCSLSFGCTAFTLHYLGKEKRICGVVSSLNKTIIIIINIFFKNK